MSKVSKAEKKQHKRAPDHILAMYVRIANQQTEDLTVLGVTLTVGGAVITGELIPNWAWAEEADRLVMSGSDGSEDSAFAIWRDRLIEMRDETTAAAGEPDSPEEATDQQRIAHAEATPAFIHLRNAQVFLGNNFAPVNDGLWRGRLTRVDGWFLGHWSPVDPTDG
jgi:hypothetical protein